MKTKMTAAMFLSFFLSACGGSPGGGESPRWEQPTGSFVEEGPMDTNDTSFQTIGCSSDSDHKFDSRLRPGDYFLTDFRSVSNNGTSVTARVKEVLNSVSEKNYSTTTTVLSISGFPGIQPGQVIHQDCKMESNGKTCKADITVESPKIEWCTVRSYESFDEKRTKGRFTLSGSGRQLSSYRVVSTARGTVYCSNKEIGKGEMKSIIIRTNDVKSLDSNYCGGSYVFSYYETSQSQNILSSGRFETVEAP